MILIRNDIITQLERYQAGAQSAAALAAWAMDQFYAIDQGRLSVDLADAELIADLLDELMFADDERFALAATDVHRLIERLQIP
jgi:hypothetical protein